MTTAQIKTWARLGEGRSVGYNPTAKEAFLKGARQFANEVVKRLGLGTADRKIHRNEGGVAVSGEASVYTPHMYVCIEQSSCGGIYYRGCDHLGDNGARIRYPNQWITWNAVISDPDAVLDKMVQFYQQATEE